MSVSKYRKLSLGLVSLLCSGCVVVASSESPIGSQELDQTPTWVVACVCTVFILISIASEKSLHKVGTWLKEKHKKALLEALEKVKAELMVLGFLSLLLTFGESYIVKICIPNHAANILLPCPKVIIDHESSSEEEHRRKLLSYERRYLSDDGTTYQCKKLHILIFFLAVLHVFYSAVTMLLGILKIRGWKAWEAETSSHGYKFANGMMPNDVLNCFLQVHLSPGSKFNFQKYIKRSLEEDFKIVGGVSPVLWASFVVFLLLNVNGWHHMFWVSLIPVLVFNWFPLSRIINKYLADGTDKICIIVQNALQVTYFLWIWYSFDLDNCFHADYKIAITKVTLGVGVLCLCSYITLPLYALVTQMGSRMKKSIFNEQTSKALKKWHMAVKKNQGVGGNTRVRAIDGSTADSTLHSSSPTLHRFNTTGHSTNHTMSIYNVQDDYQSDTELSYVSPTSRLIISVDHNELEANEK
ncbi:hypothetical protein VNO78_26895 [Psophocarpus tetragonolobus]|uniref:MLO-like protein n=1 Tax=Psophocarpus tetragonolobus TaxID=3891 RepID=A0AAN9X9K5_PSOTE